MLCLLLVEWLNRPFFLHLTVSIYRVRVSLRVVCVCSAQVAVVVELFPSWHCVLHHDRPFIAVRRRRLHLDELVQYRLCRRGGGGLARVFDLVHSQNPSAGQNVCRTRRRPDWVYF